MHRPVLRAPGGTTIGVALAVRWSVRREDGGQALVEVMLAVPIVFVVLLGGTDFARALNVDLALGSAARSAAERASLSDPVSFDAAAAVREDLGRTPGLDPAAVAVTLTTHGGDGVDGSCAEDPPTLEAPCFSTVRVVFTFHTLFDWPGVPHEIVLDRSRSFRRI
ncbi:MAG: pilus assembly protein [Chloroflexi bacterium]|nr:MAG: pilus assembly protein [Chloroflexota bacterium]